MSSSNNPRGSMNPMKWFSCCFDGDNDEDEQPQQPTLQTRQAPRTRWDAAPPVDPAQEEGPPPPPYALFDPHPEDCECAIHIHKPRPQRPIVVEAFQSQGCNSCPPTNTLLLSLLTLADPNILVLDYHVTYWDHLGWPDPFGIREADAHQREYAQAGGTSRVYTPQVVVNGLSEGAGNSTRKLEKLIKDGGTLASQDWPWLLFSKVEGGILIREATAAAAATGRRGRVLEVVYDPALREVEIPRGENAGKTLAHRNVVKSVTALGEWRGGRGVVQLPPHDLSNGLERVLIVQEGVGGQIIGVARIHF
ncbi:uncharacterized protein Z520_06846 [Fonsecaea multimorphosa CBS 102226]|uniref:DUF1223-domain-containing protein n=1 Tax=Fonsecaea multimorphosa CBS 102226 TaxID=1442371 RepID=A0A0D2K2V0_9EURO|nr:uncharacterized protein Z520_06846 [Fonsecaea multimorphosa CBS 102226]KIX97394.1 hypothetical protein Z520_06846 [Fonsecaea multimorphosa CBS 102226]OAL23362.1 hypothetical protein AYO22_06412 [Fonsecaea multimorphosa]